MADDLLERSLGHLLRRAYLLFTAADSREFVVLDALADQGGCSQQDLAERLGINRTIMVGLVDRLQAAGYVTRERNPANRRAYLLSLTDAGRRALGEMREEVAGHDLSVTAHLTPAERRRLNELLSRLLPEPGDAAVRSTGHLVAQAHHRLRRIGDGQLAELGLRTRHLGALLTLQRLAPCPQQELARRLDITEPGVAQIVDELVRAGLVVRGRDPDDRRRYALDLTGLGRERLAEVRRAMARIQAEVRGILGDEADDELRALLRKLLAG